MKSFDDWANDLAEKIHKKNNPETTTVCSANSVFSVDYATINNGVITSITTNASTIPATPNRALVDVSSPSSAVRDIVKIMKMFPKENFKDIITEIIVCTHSWDDTPEGVDFWVNVTKALEK